LATDTVCLIVELRPAESVTVSATVWLPALGNGCETAGVSPSQLPSMTPSSLKSHEYLTIARPSTADEPMPLSQVARLIVGDFALMNTAVGAVATGPPPPPGSTGGVVAPGSCSTPTSAGVSARL
jgi:hypothetical protein